ncbi:MAG: sigma-70 family RNA polymerase sigma factor [Verrucomicrobiota bacterium]
MEEDDSSYIPQTDSIMWKLLKGDDSVLRAEALEQLCRIYWYPIYGYVRRQGRNHQDAEDATQELFSRMIERDSFANIDRERGRLRSYLLASISRLLKEDWRKNMTQKRGGNATVLSIEAESGEGRYANEPRIDESPETLYDRQWAYALLGEVEKRLKADFREKGKSALFEALKPGLAGQSDNFQSYATIAASLGLEEGNVKMSMLRLRDQFRRLVREEVGSTVTTVAEVEEELQHLFAALRPE